MHSIRKLYTPHSKSKNEFDPKGKEPPEEKIIDPDSLLQDNGSPHLPEQDEEATTNKNSKTSLRDALQEWSNDDARDIEEDDSTPLRSGL